MSEFTYKQTDNIDDLIKNQKRELKELKKALHTVQNEISKLKKQDTGATFPYDINKFRELVQKEQAFNERIYVLQSSLASLGEETGPSIGPDGEIFVPEPVEDSFINSKPMRMNTSGTYADPVVYSGCDIIPVFRVGDKVISIGNLQALSYSTHRPKPAVRVLGRSYAKSYARGSLSIAGTLVWAIFDQSAMAEVLHLASPAELSSDTSSFMFLPAQLPPFDITVTYWSEAPGKLGEFRGSYLKLYGVDIVDEGQVHSIQDAYPENTMQFVARDIEHMLPITDVATSKDGQMIRSTPFHRAIFQSGLNTSTNLPRPGYDKTKNELTILYRTANEITVILNNMDNSPNSYPEGTDGVRRTRDGKTRTDIYEELSKTNNQIRIKEKELKNAEDYETLVYSKSTNPYYSIRDNPFDRATPVKL